MNKLDIEAILINKDTFESGSKLYNFIKKSASADFYNNQFLSDNLPAKEENPDFSKTPHEMQELMNFLNKNINKNAIIVELGGSRFQRRSGYPNYIFENYIPLDISYSSIKAYTHIYDKYGVVADACNLPFKDASIDVIFSHTFLEHPLRPDLVLSEINRVLKPGGYVIHSDAWNCRWWQSYGIVGVKKFSDLSLNEKMIYIGAKITEFKLIRMPIIILKRAINLFIYSNQKNVSLKYGKLKPNYNLHLYCDEDAASSIDPLNVSLFYTSRGYTLIPNFNFFQKLFFRNLNIYHRKSI